MRNAYLKHRNCPFLFIGNNVPNDHNLVPPSTATAKRYCWHRRAIHRCTSQFYSNHRMTFCLEHVSPETKRWCCQVKTKMGLTLPVDTQLHATLSPFFFVMPWVSSLLKMNQHLSGGRSCKSTLEVDFHLQKSARQWSCCSELRVSQGMMTSWGPRYAGGNPWPQRRAGGKMGQDEMQEHCMDLRWW